MLGFLPLAAAPLADNGILIQAEVTGVSATASVGSVAVDVSTSPILVGQAATGLVGSVTVTGSSTLQLVGLQATAGTNGVLIWVPISPPVSDIWTEIVL